MSLPKKTPDPDSMSFSEIDDEDKDPVEIQNDNPVDATSQAIFENPFTEMMIHVEVLLNHGYNVQSSKVQWRTKDNDKNIFGTFDSNQNLNTFIYNVELPDGAVKQCYANVIAENMYSQVDYGGHTDRILDFIFDYSKDDTSVPISEKYVTTRSGTRRLHHTTEGCHLLI